MKNDVKVVLVQCVDCSDEQTTKLYQVLREQAAKISGFMPVEFIVTNLKIDAIPLDQLIERLKQLGSQCVTTHNLKDGGDKMSSEEEEEEEEEDEE